jgi:hypothetical protein
MLRKMSDDDDEKGMIVGGFISFFHSYFSSMDTDVHGGMRVDEEEEQL